MSFSLRLTMPALPNISINGTRCSAKIPGSAATMRIVSSWSGSTPKDDAVSLPPGPRRHERTTNDIRSIHSPTNQTAAPRFDTPARHGSSAVTKVGC